MGKIKFLNVLIVFLKAYLTVKDVNRYSKKENLPKEDPKVRKLRRELSSSVPHNLAFW